MKNLNLPTLKFDRNLDSHLDSPFIEKNGLLEFNPKFITPDFLTTWTFETHLYCEPVAIDHFVITFPSRTALENYAKSFGPFGATTVEGPDLFPINFCSENINVPSDLWLHLMTLLMPAGGLVVLDAPHAAGDQKNRFQEERGLAAVHHVAIRVENVQNAATIWQNKNFQPLSDRPLDYGSLTQWFLQNPAGQIIELIERRPGNNATFDCKNIAGLRLSEYETMTNDGRTNHQLPNSL
ncbi:hypothetical protein QUB63_01765 [Microcoleus sp. ARI1-B5]|uniref:hypothetical protein n=1 Tax=unclassified Microcoleus TaxID=2642155 RepID=UPI002FD50178